MYLCVHMCIVMYLCKFKHMLSMCVLGIDECLCGDYSFTSPSLSGDGQIRLRRLPKLQLENSILHFKKFFLLRVFCRNTLRLYFISNLWVA